MKLAYRLTNFFITYTVTQTNVHDGSRLIYAQSVNENSYDYNSTAAGACRVNLREVRTNVTDTALCESGLFKELRAIKKGAEAPFSVQEN
ncbi:hypothetical protein GCM10011513_42150 [Franconibacter daqui]|nr:hypothetical protein GCM10011513_42150 [Franconibacter daqui]